MSLTSGQGFYRTLKVVSECEVEIGVDAAKMLRDPSEHQDESFLGDFWVDWNGPRGGVTLTIRQAQQNFPKRWRRMSSTCCGRSTSSIEPDMR